jgi:hypothetical protein
LWGGPPGPQPTPTSACWVWMNLISLARSGSRGTRGRGRDAGFPTPPARTRAGAANAHGSYLGSGYVWRRNARSDTVAGFGLEVVGCRGLPESVPSLVGCVDSVAGAFEATYAARRCGTPSVVPSCPGSRAIGSTPAPLAQATCPSPSEIHACAAATWPSTLSASLPCACRSSSGAP